MKRELPKEAAFAKWARLAGVTDKMLIAAVDEMSAGLYEADLGGRVYKKRIALPGRGKRGGARVIVAANFADRWVFMYGFAKNVLQNIDSRALRFYRAKAKLYMAFSEHEWRCFSVSPLVERVLDDA